jgi:hypothetical protein
MKTKDSSYQPFSESGEEVVYVFTRSFFVAQNFLPIPLFILRPAAE